MPMKDIENYPGYKVNENGIVINKNGHVMRPGLSNNGRARVSLETYDDNGKLISRKNMSVSRLVATAFIPNPDNKPIVMHIDNDPLHNHMSNLKWGTASENMLQAYREGRKIRPKLTESVYEVCNDDRSDVHLCKGREGVGQLLGIATKTVRPGDITSGKYAGYNVVNTGKRVKCPISFINKNI